MRADRNDLVDQLFQVPALRARSEQTSGVAVVDTRSRRNGGSEAVRLGAKR